MRFKRTCVLTVSILVLTMAGIQVDAHGIWFAQRSGEMALVYGEGAEDGDMGRRLPLVRGIAGYDASGNPVDTKLIPEGRLLLIDMQKKPIVLTGVLDNGVWTVGPDNNEVNRKKNEVANAKSSGHYFKYAVHIVGDLKAPLAALKGQVLQLTPVSATLPKRMGDAITLRALYQGKPLAGAAVIADFVNEPEAAPLRTDKDGLITLKVRNQGLNVISIAADAPTENTVETDKIQHRATLSFVLPPKGL